MADTGNESTSSLAKAGNNTHGTRAKPNSTKGSSTSATETTSATSDQRKNGNSCERVTGPHHRVKQKNSAVSALMLREMEELRGLSIGSPEPTPRPDDFDVFPNIDVDSTLSGNGGFFFEAGSRSSSSSPFPAITVERCMGADVDETRQQLEANNGCRHGNESTGDETRSLPGSE